MTISAAQVKELREKTGIGMMECKKALTEAGGDVNKAIDELRKRGLAKAESKAARTTAQGLIYSYIHANFRVGVIIEINCETDFVAKNEEFQGMAKDICMHIAAMNPLCVSRDQVDPAVVEKEREIYKDQVKDKPANIIDKIVDGKVDKFYSENCLMEQQYVRDDKVTIEGLLKSAIAKVGENMKIARFTRYEIGN